MRTVQGGGGEGGVFPSHTRDDAWYPGVREGLGKASELGVATIIAKISTTEGGTSRVARLPH